MDDESDWTTSEDDELPVLPSRAVAQKSIPQSRLVRSSKDSSESDDTEDSDDGGALPSLGFFSQAKKATATPVVEPVKPVEENVSGKNVEKQRRLVTSSVPESTLLRSRAVQGRDDYYNASDNEDDGNMFNLPAMRFSDPAKAPLSFKPAPFANVPVAEASVFNSPMTTNTLALPTLPPVGVENLGDLPPPIPSSIPKIQRNPVSSPGDEYSTDSDGSDWSDDDDNSDDERLLSSSDDDYLPTTTATTATTTIPASASLAPSSSSTTTPTSSSRPCSCTCLCQLRSQLRASTLLLARAYMRGGNYPSHAPLPLCANCEAVTATVTCVACGEAYCSACDATLHLRSSRRGHRRMYIREYVEMVGQEHDIVDGDKIYELGETGESGGVVSAPMLTVTPVATVLPSSGYTASTSATVFTSTSPTENEGGKACDKEGTKKKATSKAMDSKDGKEKLSREERLRLLEEKARAKAAKREEHEAMLESKRLQREERQREKAERIRREEKRMYDHNADDAVRLGQGRAEIGGIAVVTVSKKALEKTVMKEQKKKTKKTGVLGTVDEDALFGGLGKKNRVEGSSRGSYSEAPARLSASEQVGNDTYPEGSGKTRKNLDSRGKSADVDRVSRKTTDEGRPRKQRASAQDDSDDDAALFGGKSKVRDRRPTEAHRAVDEHREVVETEEQEQRQRAQEQKERERMEKRRQKAGGVATEALKMTGKDGDEEDVVGRKTLTGLLASMGTRKQASLFDNPEDSEPDIF